ncbi:MAG: PPOX class F420-dependent oxidoreductase [Dehalococcoidia bacterium]
MTKMDQTAFDAFISAPRIAHLVTLHPDGAPHAAPVWYEYTGGRFFVFTPGTSVKLDKIRRDPRVTISIASEDEPYRYVTAEGVAGLTSEGVDAQVLSIATRYRGTGAKRFLAPLQDLHLISITPSKLSTYVGT